jgi:3-methyladenine DNA glycosylase/8-oxoguanine DNA glycosylase
VLRRNDMAITHDGKALHVTGNADRKQLARMFQLDVDLGEFHALTAASPAHAWVEGEGFGRLLCAPTLFEDVVKIILTTNVTWSQTVKMAELLVAVCGRKGGFPSAQDVARFTTEELKERCRLGYRATSIHRLASGVSDGTIDLEAISDPKQTTGELFESYRTLPGIGPYGAAHLLAMDGRHDFIAVDTEFRRHVRQTYHKGRAVSDAAMLRRYAKWGRWKYLAYWAELWGAR